MYFRKIPFVAADVGDPGGGGQLDRQAGQCPGGEADVAGGEHGPDLDHEGVVVGQVGDLAGVLALAEILEELSEVSSATSFFMLCPAILSPLSLTPAIAAFRYMPRRGSRL